MTEEPKRPAAPPAEKPGVEGGDRDVSTDQQPLSDGTPPEPDDDSAVFEEGRQGGRREDLN